MFKLDEDFENPDPGIVTRRRPDLSGAPREVMVLPDRIAKARRGETPVAARPEPVQGELTIHYEPVVIPGPPKPSFAPRRPWLNGDGSDTARPVHPPPPSPAPLVFAYGSNLNGRQMRERVPGELSCFRATLPGYRLDFVGKSAKWEGGVATVTEMASLLGVPGLVWRLPVGGLDLLDRFEGHPGTYVRKRVRLTLDEGGHLKAWVYVHQKPVLAPPSLAYVSTIARGAAAHRVSVDHVHHAAFRALAHKGALAPDIP
jgi:gamma-glutamylcyclotransferase (GGCT)/AIG2-like uncharacterized protein YtfP